MGCGGTLYNTRGVVTSPNFPQGHAQLSNCQWTLKVPPGQKIELRFTRKKKIWFFIRASYATLCDVSHAYAECLKIMKKSHFHQKIIDKNFRGKIRQNDRFV